MQFTYLLINKKCILGVCDIYHLQSHLESPEQRKTHSCVYIYIYIYIYIQSWSELLAPMVNIINEGCENESALLIRLIFY